LSLAIKEHRDSQQEQQQQQQHGRLTEEQQPVQDQKQQLPQDQQQMLQQEQRELQQEGQPSELDGDQMFTQKKFLKALTHKSVLDALVKQLYKTD
jgi:hypothetical protein